MGCNRQTVLLLVVSLFLLSLASPVQAHCLHVIQAKVQSLPQDVIAVEQIIPPVFVVMEFILRPQLVAQHIHQHHQQYPILHAIVM